jgi:hypothetical protein
MLALLESLELVCTNAFSTLRFIIEGCSTDGGVVVVVDEDDIIDLFRSSLCKQWGSVSFMK